MFRSPIHTINVITKITTIKNKFMIFGLRSFSVISQNIQNKDNSSKTSFLSFLDPKKTKKITYSMATPLDVGQPLSPQSKRNIIDSAISSNPDLQMDYIFNKRFWDLDDFKKQNHPIVIADIDDRQKFSTRTDKELWTLDLPIKMPGKGWMIPSELSQFSEFIQKSDSFEQIINPLYDECYAYLCVDQRPVMPGKSQRRPGYHGDSFITPYTHDKYGESDILHDSIYVASDCIPTIFNPGPFPFSNMKIATDPIMALDHFETMANSSLDTVLDSYRIIKLDPTVIHRVGKNESDLVMNRTFAKLVYSRDIFNRLGNNINLLFDYNWPMIDRSTDNRNTSSVRVEIINGRKYSDYIFLSPEILKFLMHDSNKRVFRAEKYQHVAAYPATPGELLQTIVNGSITTQNTAKIGDWKITTQQGDQYFLPLKSLMKFYNHCNVTGSKYIDCKYNFYPKPDIVKVFQINEFVKFIPSWGTMQYLIPGDYLVMRGDEIYGVKKDSFESNYLIMFGKR